MRINANGKRLDAWLIYRCNTCDATWNRPVFERKPVKSLDAQTIEAVTRSDPGFVCRVAFDLDGLARHAQHVETSDDVAVSKTVLSGDVDHACCRLEIELELSLACRVRLDRLLARELDLSRSRISALFAEERLELRGGVRNPLRVPVRTGMRIALDLRDTGDAVDLVCAASVPHR